MNTLDKNLNGLILWKLCITFQAKASPSYNIVNIILIMSLSFGYKIANGDLLLNPNKELNKHTLLFNKSIG